MLYIGIAFAALSCLVCVTNIISYAMRMVKKRRGETHRKSSAIHVLSIVFSIMAYVFAGDTLGGWVFIPAVLDPATLFILAAPILLIRMKKEGGRQQDRQ
jgi:Mn2+/Fe2+ NRAMP family transporter